MGKEKEQEVCLAWAAKGEQLGAGEPQAKLLQITCKSSCPGVVPVNKLVCLCLRSGELLEEWGETAQGGDPP